MAAGSALALALEVHGDPLRIDAARQAALPADIGRLLQLLSGHGGRLQQAAIETGTSPGQLLEAARHYVREAMLHEDASDARMLGLGPGAGPDDLKRNYRALQAWLHPDRDAAPADAQVLSARVNVAWSRLRDMGAFQDRVVKSGELRPRWRKVEEPDTRSVASRVRPVAGVLVVLAVLGVLTWRAATGPADVPSLGAGAGLGAASVARPAMPASSQSHATDPAAEVVPADVPADPAEQVALPPARTAATGSVSVPVPAPAPLPEAEPAPVPLPVAMSAPGSRPAMSVAPPVPRPDPPVRLPAVREAAAAAAPTLAAVLEVPATGDPVPDPFAERNAQARMHADSLYAYLVRASLAAPPIWHSGAALDQADRARRALAVGGVPTQVWREQATWRFVDDQAELRVPVGPATGASRDTRLLRTQWQWKQGAWWVTRVSLEES